MYFRDVFMKLSNTSLFLIPSLIWGSTWYAIKFQIGTTDPLYSVAFRFFLAAFVLIAFIMAKGGSVRFSWKTHLYFMLQGVCLFGINYWLVYMSEEHLTSGLVAVIFGGLIFLNVFLSALFLNAKVQIPVVIGGVIGTVGIGLIFKDELSVFDFSDMNLPETWTVIKKVPISIRIRTAKTVEYTPVLCGILTGHGRISTNATSEQQTVPAGHF